MNRNSILKFTHTCEIIISIITLIASAIFLCKGFTVVDFWTKLWYSITILLTLSWIYSAKNVNQIHSLSTGIVFLLGCAYMIFSSVLVIKETHVISDFVMYICYGSIFLLWSIDYLIPKE